MSGRAWMRRGRWTGLALAALALCAAARPATAQLISPGELTAAHAELDGIRNCTNCHELRQRGVSEARCLACHEPLAAQIEAGGGLHARVDGTCASCHKDHGGRGLDIVRFDSLAFEHAPRTGFELTGSHAELSCRDCHTPALITTPAVRLFKRGHGSLDHTFLGLGTGCLSCHTRDDPHDGQFGRVPCSDCHGETGWTPAPGFDHDATRYRLTGKHRAVECEDCHDTKAATDGGRSLVFGPLAFGSCTSCHEDHHAGAMGPSCSDCHSTAGWTIDRSSFEGGFDHERTGFLLTGAHGDLDCAGCHDAGAAPATIRMSYDPVTTGREYPRPVADDCLSCHVDLHEGAFEEIAGGPSCAGCHGEDAWLPSAYDLFRHNAETGFELTGAHLATPCWSCHARDGDEVPHEFRIADQSCAGCHAADEPHGGQFAPRACTDCHTVETFTIAAFDHDRTAYPLDGAHRDAPCVSCHRAESPASGGEPVVRYTPLDTACRSCHEGGP